MPDRSGSLAPALTVLGCAVACGLLLAVLKLQDAGTPPTRPQDLTDRTLATPRETSMDPRPASAPSSDRRSSPLPDALRAASRGPGSAGEGSEDVDPGGALRPGSWLERALSDDAENESGNLVTNRALPGGAPPFDARDLAVLQDLIDANALSETTSPFDYDDGDGRFDPWELGLQAWRDGRLVALVLGPDPFSSFGYALGELPPSIGELDALQLLDVHGGELEALPDEIGGLRALRELRVYRNRMTALPDTIGELSALETLAAGDNLLGALPESMGRLTRLSSLYLENNRLGELPSFLGRLSLVRLDVRNAAVPGGGFALESILASAPLEELHVTQDDVGSSRADSLARVPNLYGIAAAPGHGPR